MTEKLYIGRARIERLNNTKNGNPRYKVYINDLDSGQITANTKPNAGYTYSICSSWDGAILAGKLEGGYWTDLKLTD